MTWVSRRVFVPLVGLVALGSILSACSRGSTTGAVGTAGQINSFVTVDVSSPPIITVQNRTAAPPLDLNIAIKSGMLTLTHPASPLATKETRPLPPGDVTRPGRASLHLR